MSAESPNIGPKPQENVFSLEDLDKIIESEDPNFKEDMENIKSSGQDIDADIQSVDFDPEVENGKDEEDSEELKRKLTYRLLQPWRKLKEKFHLKFMAYQNRLKLIVPQIKNFIRHELPERIKYYKVRFIGAIKKAKNFLVENKNQFLQLSRIQKISVFIMTLGSIASLFLLSKAITGAWLPQFVSPLVQSLEAKATYVDTLKNNDDLQNLFQAFPEAEFFVLLNKVIVNLKPDSNSNQNPMGIYEMYLGLDSQDTAIEVKDREREILDITQRTLEQFTFSEVSSRTGKTRMKSAVRQQINLILNQGQVFQVYFNTFITNP